MCRDHIHQCKSCQTDYECVMPNWLCPTLNFDADGLLCEPCKEKLVQEIDSELDTYYDRSGTD